MPWWAKAIWLDGVQRFAPLPAAEVGQDNYLEVIGRIDFVFTEHNHKICEGRQLDVADLAAIEALLDAAPAPSDADVDALRDFAARFAQRYPFVGREDAIRL